MELGEKMISGESTLNSSLRAISPNQNSRSPATELSPEGRYLDVSDIIKRIFPNLDDNSLGERRDLMLKQAEQAEKQRFTQSDLDSVDSRSLNSRGAKSGTTGSESGLTEVEKDYAEDEEWHHKMMEYLARATKEFEQIDAHLTRTERSIVEARGRAVSADKNRKAHRLAPIKPSTLPSFINENFLTEDGLPRSLLLPSQFYPTAGDSMTDPVEESPRYKRHTENSRLSHQMNEKPTQIELRECESRTSSLAEKSQLPTSRTANAERAKSRRPKVALSEPGVNNRGLCRADDDEHVRIQNDLRRMQNVAFDFLKNPRSEAPLKSDIFDAVPNKIVFRKWQVGIVLETMLEIRNKDTVSRSVTVLPPENPRFHLGLGRYPSTDGRVGPGLSVSYRVQFMPDTLADDESEIEVRHPGGSFKVPILAIRDKPILTIPSPIVVGYTLVGGKSETIIRIVNHGGPGKFCFVRKDEWPSANFRNSVTPGSTTFGPFTIWPSVFEINGGEERDLVLNFNPTALGRHSYSLHLTCDNCQTKEIEFVGVAEEAMIQVHMEQCEATLGELYDRQATHRINFEPVVARNSVTVAIGIENKTHIPLPFHFQLMKPDLVAFSDMEDAPKCEGRIARVEDTNSPFLASPPSGLLAAASTTTVHFTFSPERAQKYSAVSRLSLVGIPNQDEVSKIIPAEFELNGTCIPVVGQLLPPVLDIPGEIPAGSRLKRQIHLLNPSIGDLSFEWKSLSSICSVEPAYGTIPPRQMVPLQVCFEAEIPGKSCERMICSLDGGEAMELTVIASVKPPMVNVNIDKVAFGICEVGTAKTIQFAIDNRNPIPTMWTVDANHPDIKINIKSGILEPLQSTTLVVTWSPTDEYDFDNIRLNFGGATHSEFLISGTAVRPRVEFVETSFNLGELFVGVEKQFEIELVNLSPVPAHFQLIPIELLPCVPPETEISINNSAGCIPPASRHKVLFSMTGWRPQTFKDLILAVEVANSKSPSFIEINAQVKELAVQVWSEQEDKQSLNIELDIEELKVHKVWIKNVTAIQTHFAINAKNMKATEPKIKLNIPGFTWNPEAANINIENKFGLDQRALLLHDQPHTKEAKVVRRDFSRAMRSGTDFGVGILTQPDRGSLGPFELREVAIVTSGGSWGTYQDSLVISVGDLEPIVMATKINILSAPISFPARTVRFGTISTMAGAAKRKVPMTNMAPHAVNVNLNVLNDHDMFLYRETGHIPDELDDEQEPTENSPFIDYVHAGIRKEMENPFTAPGHIQLEANETKNIEIAFKANSRISGVVTSTLIGQVSAPYKFQVKDGLFNRPSGTFGPTFDISLSANAEFQSFQLEEIDSLDFFSNAWDVCNAAGAEKRAFTVFNSAGMTSSVEVRVDHPFKINAEYESIMVTLPPKKRKILYVTLEITNKILEDFERFNFVCNDGYLVAEGELKTDGLLQEFSLQCKARISLPKVTISADEFDFGTGFIGDTFKRELCLDNGSTCATAFSFEVLDGSFEVTPEQGVIQGGQVLTVEIAFRPEEEVLYDRIIKLRLYQKEFSIRCIARGTKDAAFANQLRF